MTWEEFEARFAEFVVSLGYTPPATSPPPPPPPTSPPPPPPPAQEMVLPTGPIQTKGPKGQDLGSWDDLARWEPLFTNATHDAGDAFAPLLLGCFAIVETASNHYTTGEMTGEREEVIVAGHGGAAGGIGMMQIIPLHFRVNEDAYDVATNVYKGARLLAGWLKSEGNWEAALTNKWHPGIDPRSGYTPQTYIETVRKLIAEAKGQPAPSPPPPPVTAGWTAHQVAGSGQALWLPSDIPFEIILTPVGPNRSGARLNWTGTTQHETGNESPSADMRMHSRWQDAGTPGHPDGKIGVHFYNDDTGITQKIPINEQGVHSGDWRNQQHTAIERCVHKPHDFARSEHVAACLQAGLLNILGRSAVQELYSHRTKPGPGCPVYIGGHWAAFEAEVDSIRRSIP